MPIPDNAFRRGVPVLMYHHISPRHDVHTVHPATFRAQLEWLVSNGYKTISASEFEMIKKGVFIPDFKPILLTFDDGWLDNYIYALPILKEYQSKSVFFIVTSWPEDKKERIFLNDSNMPKTPAHAQAMKVVATDRKDEIVMRWSEIETAMATGLVEVHSHSHYHGLWWENRYDLQKLADSFENDIAISQSVLKKKLGYTSTHFCWPKGLFTDNLVARARRFGFTRQYTTLCGVNTYGSDKMTCRLNIEEKDIAVFKRKIKFYGEGLSGKIAGFAHQIKQSYRMTKFMKP